MKRTPAAGVTLLLALAMTGCGGGDPEPKFAPTPTQTTPTPTTPTTTPTQEPVALTPEQTVRAWVKGRNKLVATGESAEVMKYSGPRCGTCMDLITPIRDLYRQGGEIRTQGWSVQKAAKNPDFRRIHQVVAAIDLSAGVTLPSEAAEPEPFEADNKILQFTVAKVEDDWLVAKIVFLS